MLRIHLCLIHIGGMRGEHLRKGLFQVHIFLGRWFAHSGVVACCSDCSSIHNPDFSNYYVTLGPDSGSDSCCYTDPAVVTNFD